MSFRVEVISGPDRGASARSRSHVLSIGRGADCTLRLTDAAVSHYHAELVATPEGIRLEDLRSANGTFFRDVRLGSALLRGEAELTVGETRLRVVPGDARDPLAVSPAASFHGLIGSSRAMRAVYAKLAAASRVSSTVLLLGECGTGKEIAAHALHAEGARKDQHFEVVHCGGLPPTLVESLLFGHERGAFTGAVRAHVGAFERADGGTIFLDEVGELPVESQPKLLRVLESGEFQRLGERRGRQTDVRVIAATNRDLRDDVNTGRFRADLFYRLSVIQVRMPALREHPEDLGPIAEALIAHIRAVRKIDAELTVDAALLRELHAHAWPGNVRELRNYLEEWLVFRQQPERDGAATAPADAATESVPLRTHLSLREARDEFDAAFVLALLKQQRWQISEAARAADIDRVTLFRLMRRLGIERPA